MKRIVENFTDANCVLWAVVEFIYLDCIFVYIQFLYVSLHLTIASWFNKIVYRMFYYLKFYSGYFFNGNFWI